MDDSGSRKNMASTFAAEQGLLSSLRRKRTYHGDVKLTNVRGHPEHTDVKEDLDLTQYRVRYESGDVLKDKELTTQVASLDHQPVTWKEPRSEYALLTSSYQSRKDRHEAAMDGFHHKLVDLCEDLEGQVIQSSRDLRDYLAEVKQRIAKIFARLNDDEFMTGQDHEYVHGVHGVWWHGRMVCSMMHSVQNGVHGVPGAWCVQASPRAGGSLLVLLVVQVLQLVAVVKVYSSSHTCVPTASPPFRSAHTPTSLLLSSPHPPSSSLSPRPPLTLFSGTCWSSGRRSTVSTKRGTHPKGTSGTASRASRRSARGKAGCF